MDGQGLSASDIALLNKDGGNLGWGESSFMWIFALLILANGGFGGWGSNNAFANAIGYENLATSNEVQRGFDSQNSMANQREILAAVNNGTAQSVAATNQSFHDSLAAMQNLYNETARDIAALQVQQAQAVANQNQCCCETKMLIQQTASANELAMSQMEARLNSKMDANVIQGLRDQINALQLSQAMTGVVKYPMASTYSSGNNPFCGCGC